MRLAFLHGFMGAPSSWDDVRAMVRSPVERALALRPLGHGEGSDAPDFDAEVKRLLARLDAGDAGPWLLAGYSLGSRLALGMLLARPKRFCGALLIAPHPGLTHASEIAARLALDEERATRLEQGGLAPFLDAWERLPLFASQRDLPEEKLHAQRRVRLGHDAAELARSLRVLGLGRMPSYGSALASLDMPIAWLVGEQDPRFLALARTAVPELGDARLAVAAGAGHNLLLERPAFVAGELDALWKRVLAARSPAQLPRQA